MEDLKALQLFQEVLAKTKAGRIRWEPTASETEYFSVLPHGRTILVSLWHGEDEYGEPNSDEYALVLKDDTRELLRVTPEIDGIDKQRLSELYDFARRTALRVDAAVDQVLGDLARL